MHLRTTAIVGAAALAACASALPAHAASTFSYVEPVASGVVLDVLATSGDRIGGYLLPGIPDGIGVLKDGKDVTIFVNHELSASDKLSAAQIRAGGAASTATVSALNLDGTSRRITGGTEAIKAVTWFDYGSGQYASKPVAPAGAATKDSFGTPLHGTALNRFCSSHMAQPGDLAFKTTVNGKPVTYGYTGPVYFTGEEGGDESRAFALTNSGQLLQLPKVGLAAWENFIVAPATGLRTVIMANEDGAATDSQLWMYLGQKQATGGWADKAGLTNGQAYVMSVEGIANDNAFRAAKGKGSPANVTFAAIDTTVNGAQQNAMARALGTEMARVEDGAFDPKNPNDYYFVTTESNKDAGATMPNPAAPTVPRDGGALWRLRFNDVKNPLAGATLTLLLDGTEAPYLNKPDNIDVDAKGNILIQEDPGNNDHISRIVAYRISDGKLGVVAKFKDAYFSPKGAQFITKDEESSGITDITGFLKRSPTDANSYFVFDSQVHAPTASARLDVSPDKAAADGIANAIEGGQIYLMTVTDWSTIYG